MAEIHNTGTISPREKQMYEKEYQHGAALFEKALEQTCKSNYQPQKEQFREVMNKAMTVLNQAAKELKNNELIAQNKKIEKDFEAFKKDPTLDRANVLKEDLNTAKGSIQKKTL